jgi:hypothetical protein
VIVGQINKLTINKIMNNNQEYTILDRNQILKNVNELIKETSKNAPSTTLTTGELITIILQIETDIDKLAELSGISVIKVEKTQIYSTMKRNQSLENLLIKLKRNLIYLQRSLLIDIFGEIND